MMKEYEKRNWYHFFFLQVFDILFLNKI